LRKLSMRDETEAGAAHRAPDARTRHRARVRRCQLVAWVALTLATSLALPALAQPHRRTTTPPSVWNEVIQGAASERRGVREALLLHTRGDAEGAIAALNRLLAHAPDHEEIAGALLSVHYALGDHDTVVQLASAWIRDEPSLSRTQAVRHFRAMSLAHQGRYAEALDDLLVATRHRESLSDAHIYYGNLGDLYAAVGDLGRAALFYRQALSASPGYVLARLGLATVLDQLGDEDGARQHVLQALLDDPSRGYASIDGVFYVPDGKQHLERTLIYEAEGRVADAVAAFEAFRHSEAGAEASPEYVARVQERIGGTASRVLRYRAPCEFIVVSANAPQSYGAMVCYDGSIWHGPLDDDLHAWTQVSGRAELWIAGASVYDVVACELIDNNEALIILYETGHVGYVPLVDTPSVPRPPFLSYSLRDNRPLNLLPGGAGVLFGGFYDGRFTTLPWTDPTATPVEFIAPGVNWLSSGAASADGLSVIYSDEYQVHTVNGAGGSTVAPAPRLVSLPSRSGHVTGIAVSPDGSHLAVVQGSVGLVLDTTTFSVVEIVTLSEDALDPGYPSAHGHGMHASMYDPWAMNRSLVRAAGPHHFVFSYGTNFAVVSFGPLERE